MQEFRPHQLSTSRETIGCNDNIYDDKFTRNIVDSYLDNQPVSRQVACNISYDAESSILCQSRNIRPCSCAEYSTFVKENSCRKINENTPSSGERQTAEHDCDASCLKAKSSQHFLSYAGKCLSSHFPQQDSTRQDTSEKGYHCHGCCDLHFKQNGLKSESKQTETQKKHYHKSNEIGASHINLNTNESQADISISNSDLKERDELIRDYQLQQMTNGRNVTNREQNEYVEFDKLRKSYNNLKKMFLALATLNIILILCVVSIMPVILVTFKLHGSGEVPSDEDIENIAEKQLSSDKAKELVKNHVFCVDCKRITRNKFSDIFNRKDGELCCVTDVASLAERVLTIKEKKLNSLVNTKMENYKSKSNGGKYESHGIFNESGKVAFPDSETEKLSGLVNTLLTRKRSAIHLSGTSNHSIEWRNGYPEKLSGKLEEQSNAIRVASGGVYFLYSSIRFEVGPCDRKYVGYKVMLKHDSMKPMTVASIQHACKGGNNSETDLILQKVIEVTVKRVGTTTLYVEVEYSPDLVSKNHHHYFGLFEI